MSNYKRNWLLCLAGGVFAFDGSLGMLLPLVPRILSNLNITTDYLGMPVLLLGLGQIAGTFFYSFALSKYKERKVFLNLTFLVLIATGILYLTLKNFTYLLFATFLQGLGSGMIWQLSLVLISEIYSQDEQAKMNGFIFASFNFSTIIAPVYASFIFELFGTFGVGCTLLGFGVILQISSILCPQRLQHHSQSNYQYLNRHQIFSHVFVSGILLSFISAGLRAGVETLVPLILVKRFSFKEQYIGLIWLFITVPATISSLLLGILTKKLGEFVLLTSGLAFSIISMLLVFYTTQIYLFYTGLTFLALGFTLTAAPVPSYMCNLLKADPSALHGFRNLFTALGIGLYPLSLGFLQNYLSQRQVGLTLILSVSFVVPFLFMAHKTSSSKKKLQIH
eukprot:NODE_104_length_19294_cov_0.449179.p5 type:complete len:393 gc:universal NODE_104_length_19294_cov_0.449179:17638-18816(+)